MLQTIVKKTAYESLPKVQAKALSPDQGAKLSLRLSTVLTANRTIKSRHRLRRGIRGILRGGEIPALSP